MQKLFIISYSGRNSSGIEQVIKTYGTWFHFSKDTFLIHEKTTALDIRNKLESKIAVGKDKLLILEISIKDAEGWLQDNEWSWLKTRKS